MDGLRPELVHQDFLKNPPQLDVPKPIKSGPSFKYRCRSNTPNTLHPLNLSRPEIRWIWATGMRFHSGAPGSNWVEFSLTF